MKRSFSFFIVVLVFVWAFPIAVFGQTISPGVEIKSNQKNVISPNAEQDVDQEDNDDEEDEKKKVGECTEYIPPDERNPNLSPEEKEYAEKNRKYLEENFVCEEEGDYYQKWVSKDQKVVTYIWTKPHETVYFWTPEKFKQAKPMIMYADDLQPTNKKIQPKGPPGKIDPKGPEGS